ncbi:MAG TPA: IS1595 family transposase [Candidatus Babeliales bacterium]|jgi:transposase|nr:IS1595 family transposase [Candidatus Babeliales bacterium]
MEKKSRKSRLPKKKISKLMEHFVAGTTARTAASLVEVNRNTATNFYRRWREMIAKNIEDLSVFDGEVEADESYFGGRRKGKRGRGAAGKVPVFGLLKRKGRVYTTVIKDTKSSTLMPIINKKIVPDSIVYTDTYRSYNALDVSNFHHERINHSTLFADKQNHINGIENFWNQAKRHLRKFNGGVPKSNFYYFIKECEWRFNFGSPQKLLKTLKGWAKSNV